MVFKDWIMMIVSATEARNARKLWRFLQLKSFSPWAQLQPQTVEVEYQPFLLRSEISIRNKLQQTSWHGCILPKLWWLSIYDSVLLCIGYCEIILWMCVTFPPSVEYYIYTEGLGTSSWGHHTLDITILPLNSNDARCDRYTPFRMELAVESHRCAAAIGKYNPLPKPVPLESFMTSLEPNAYMWRQMRNPSTCL